VKFPYGLDHFFGFNLKVIEASYLVINHFDLLNLVLKYQRHKSRGVRFRTKELG